MEQKINIARMLKDSRTTYRRYSDNTNYPTGSGRDLALQDQLTEIWSKMYPNDRCPDIAEITGNQWEDSDRDDFDQRIAIGGGWYQYTNNGYNCVLKGLK